jgi:hypothetical protein
MPSAFRAGLPACLAVGARREVVPMNVSDSWPIAKGVWREHPAIDAAGKGWCRSWTVRYGAVVIMGDWLHSDSGEPE